MEKQWFDWESWGELGTMSFAFNGVVMKVGPLKGLSFDSATVDYDKAVVELYDKDGRVLHAFDIIAELRPA